MKEAIYKISIPSDNFIEDECSPYCYAGSYDEAVEIARPWVEQGHYVILVAVRREDIKDE